MEGSALKWCPSPGGEPLSLWGGLLRTYKLLLYLDGNWFLLILQVLVYLSPLHWLLIGICQTSPVPALIPYYRIQFMPFMVGNDHFLCVYLFVWSCSCLLSLLLVNCKLHKSRDQVCVVHFCTLGTCHLA